jgi:hypothetical protein
MEETARSKKMKVLIACEFSGVVREAFKKRGHDAWSCDLLPTDIPGQHIQYDVLDLLDDRWDLIIAHPPCTHLTISGARWFKEKRQQQKDAIDFFMRFISAPAKKICVENPIGIISTVYRKPDQIIQPYQFGHKTRKSTCLWLKNLPLLKPTKIVKPVFVIGKKDGKRYSLWHIKSGKGCGKERSVTFQGIADAMATQWG